MSSTLTIQKGKSFQLKSKISPKKAQKSAQLVYQSSNGTIASVSKKGKISAKKVGKAKITIKSNMNKKIKGTIKVSVINKLKKVKKITLNQNRISLVLGGGDESYPLQATIQSPKKPTVKKFNWYSTNKKIATVNKNGVVTAKKAGNAKIIVTSADGQGAKATCQVTVSNGNPSPGTENPKSTATPGTTASASPSTIPPTPPTDTRIVPSIVVPGERTGIKQGEILQLTAKDKNTDSLLTDNITWSVNEIEGVSIDNTGLLTVAKNVDAGKTITVTLTTSESSDSATFTVIENLAPEITENMLQLNQDKADTPLGLTYRSKDAYSWVSDPERGDVVRFDASKGYTSNSYDVLAWMVVDPIYAGKTVTISAYMKYDAIPDVSQMNLVINERWGYSNPAYKYNAEPDTWYYVTGTFTLPENTGSRYNGDNNRLYITRDASHLGNPSGANSVNAIYYIDNLTFTVEKSEIDSVELSAAGGADTIYQNHTLQFSSKVNGTNAPIQKVNYSIEPAVKGASIDESGLLTVGNVAANTEITVKAAAYENPEKCATKTIKVLAQTIDSIQVTAPDSPKEIYQNNELQFTANVTGTGEPDLSVAWSVIPSVSGITLSQNGLLQVGNVADGTTITVTATSVFDNSKSDSYTITVKENKINSVTVNSAGGKTTVEAGSSINLSATVDVTGTPSTEVTWSIPNAVDGANITPNGNMCTLSVGDAVNSGTPITVRATSVFDAKKYGEITISVENASSDEFDLNKLDVEYWEDFDGSSTTLDTVKSNGIISYQFTDPSDPNFAFGFDNDSLTGIISTYGIHKTDTNLDIYSRGTNAFRGFFGDTNDYLQFNLDNTTDTEKTYTLSFLFCFFDIGGDGDFIDDVTSVNYNLPLKLVALDESDSQTTIKENIQIPFRCNYTGLNTEYYDINTSIKVPAKKKI
ncbi:MAG: Ig-like domain-containing protein, partial [Lachnospiraceae bacterium]|nr:Ig-like domain-containing protein [Lachnospiraceae bacterium]